MHKIVGQAFDLFTQNKIGLPYLQIAYVNQTVAFILNCFRQNLRKYLLFFPTFTILNIKRMSHYGLK